MSKELYKRYRPKKFSEVIGQTAAVQSIRKLIETDNIPHAIMLAGPSGVGKTTIARILKDYLSCSDQDFVEKNCADFRGVDDIRDVRRHSGFSPLGGKTRIFLIDECHKLTNDAQNALLKMLEDTPKHVYFILCTTEPHKMLKTIQTRCSFIKLVSLSTVELTTLLKTVAKSEGLAVSSDVITEIVDVSEGSARKALVILDQVGKLETEKEQLRAIETTTFSKDEAFKLAQQKEIARLLVSMKELEQDVEGIRRMILGYARAILLKGGPLAPRSFVIIDIFSKNFWDSGHAGLAAACYEVTTSK